MRISSSPVWLIGLLLVGSIPRANGRTHESRPVLAALNAQDLRCEYAAAPLGIDVLQPRLSWILKSPQRGQRQTAYQILVARSAAQLAHNKGDLWDSGKVSSEQSTQVVYAGQPLQSGEACYWKVRAWDKDNAVSSYSALATWEMGLLHSGDWHAHWIGYTPPATTLPTPPAPPFALGDAWWIWYPEGDPLTNVPTETRYFRRVVTLPADRHIKAARLRIAADNGAVVYVNGKEVGRSNDSWKTFDLFDVSPYLQPGPNILAVSVHNDGTAAGLALRFEAQFETGLPLEVLTDKTWKTFNKAVDGWQNVGTDEAAWLPAQEVVQVGGGPWGKVLDSAAPAAPPAPPAPLLRRVFETHGKIRRARAYICGLGYYELRLNGQKVGDHILDPGYTRYDKRDLYVTYDVTSYLKAGRNVVGVILGTGWYDAHVLGVWDFDKAPWRARPELLLELRVEYEDGRTATLTSDNSWQVATGPIIFDSIYAGENYDARLEKPGWDTATYNAANWAMASLVPAPKGQLVAQAMPPIKVAQILKPVKLSEPKPGVFLYDLGQNFAGLPQLTVSGPAGAKVMMRCGEKLNTDGTLDQSNIDVFVKRPDPKMQYQTDIYTLKGSGPEVWSPRFTYHGFQYVEVTGFPGRPTLENLRGLVIHSAMPSTGHFECSNPLLNAIQRNTLWSYLSNFQGIPTDCPHREKNGWTGDAQLAAEQGMYNFGSAANYIKWLNDLEDEQRPNGELPGIVPSAGWGYGTGPAWDSAYPLICWYLYQYYGDARPLQQHYAHLRRYVDYLTSIAQGGIVSTGLGDWVAPGPTAPVAETDTAYYYRDALIVAQAATLLGKTAEARQYNDLAASIRQAFNAKFFDPKTGSYADGSQTALSCALYQGLVEPEQRAAVVQNLVAAVDKQNGHIFTGILGAKYVMNTLLDNDRVDVAYKIATQKTAPGWSNWIERGATTLWEDWGGSSSLNHIMFGDISAWFYKALAGIKGDPAVPGFKHFFIQPQIVGDLTSARGEYDSIHGPITSDWQLKNGQFNLIVTVPVNTSATVFIPGIAADQVLESGRVAAQAEGVKLLRVEAGHAIFEVGSGTYHFSVPMT